VKSSVNKVPQKQVIGRWAITGGLEELLEIPKLPMDITTNLKKV
jgi:hypothetical protein